tara:strand:+ start:73 stop:303 length:231 start_codon:yes stop_codon:yes gene_type:complete
VRVVQQQQLLVWVQMVLILCLAQSLPLAVAAEAQQIPMGDLVDQVAVAVVMMQQIQVVQQSQVKAMRVVMPHRVVL